MTVADFPSAWHSALAASARAALARAVDTAESAIAAGATVLPARERWFHALQRTPPERVRIVLLGQDPYPTPGNAMGLAFSVARGRPLPASLRNIYKELASDLGFTPPVHGDLGGWADQGVLLLNAALTVEAHKANSHARIGWAEVTDALIAHVSARAEAGVVFMLWGGKAQKKAAGVDDRRHLVLRAAHPSPLSARGFFGCRHFSRANAWLRERGLASVDWAVL